MPHLAPPRAFDLSKALSSAKTSPHKLTAQEEVVELHLRRGEVQPPGNYLFSSLFIFFQRPRQHHVGLRRQFAGSSARARRFEAP